MKNLHVMLAALSGFMYNEVSGDRIPFAAQAKMPSRCDPSRHNVLRYDQVERRRKTLRRARWAANKRYRRTPCDSQ